MTPANLAATVLSAARALFETRGLDVAALPESTTLERPRNPEHGDYASTLALQLGKKVGVVFLPAGGLPWPDFLSTRTVDGTRSGPGVLILMCLVFSFARRGSPGEEGRRTRTSLGEVAAERQSLPR